MGVVFVDFLEVLFKDSKSVLILFGRDLIVHAMVDLPLLILGAWRGGLCGV